LEGHEDGCGSSVLGSFLSTGAHYVVKRHSIADRQPNICHRQETEDHDWPEKGEL
jgi:hypothetical protein